MSSWKWSAGSPISISSGVWVIALVDAGFVKPGACVVDVGTTRGEGKRIHGDVDRESVEPVAGWLTPVPGGVGPMTIAMLMRNAMSLATARRPLPARA